MKTPSSRRPLLATLVLLAGCAGTTAPPDCPQDDPPQKKDTVNEIELELLTHVQGDRYAEVRDSVLASFNQGDERNPGMKARKVLAELMKGPDWKRATQARILAGWRDHAALYAKVIEKLETADVERARKSAVGVAGLHKDFADMALEEWKQDVLPLCWEILLKFSGEWPEGLGGGGESGPSAEWRVTAAVRMVIVVPDENSIAPLIWFIEHTSNDEARSFAAIALAELPDAAVRAAVAKAQERNDARKKRQQGIDFTLSRALRALDRK